MIRALLLAAAIGAGVSVGPALADEPAPPDLKVTLAFDKPSYQKVTASGGIPYSSKDTRTDAQGRFVFRGLIGGSYGLSIFADEWNITATRVSIDGTHNPDIEVRAVRPARESLTVDMRFAKDTYAVGETAELTVRLTNNGDAPLTGITVFASGQIPNGPVWGELANGGPGVAVPAKSSRTFEVSTVVSQESFNLGHLSVTGDFGNPTGGGAIRASASVRVPGGIAQKLSGNLHVIRANTVGTASVPPSDPLPNTKVLLKEETGGKIVARAVTDANGHFEFINVPANRYVFGVVGHTFVVSSGSGDGHLQVTAGETRSLEVWVSKGGGEPDPDPPTSTTPQPQPQPGVPPPAPKALAKTGADVTWLAIGGLLALAIGAGLVIAGRRVRGS